MKEIEKQVIDNYPKKFFILDKTGVVPKPMTVVIENKEKEKVFHKTVKPFIDKGQGEVTQDEHLNFKWEIDYLQLQMLKTAVKGINKF